MPLIWLDFGKCDNILQLNIYISFLKILKGERDNFLECPQVKLLNGGPRSGSNVVGHKVKQLIAVTYIHTFLCCNWKISSEICQKVCT